MAVEILTLQGWGEVPTGQVQHQAITALENGKVVLLPQLAFNLQPFEAQFLSPDICGKRKNISYDIRSDKLASINEKLQDVATLKTLMQRYATMSRTLLSNLFPHYNRTVVQARTSFRPVEIKGRVPASYRKDDTRLHVDAFPASPTQGRRILRIFSNVNPLGVPRVWRVGDEFANVVEKFAPTVQKPSVISAKLLKLLKITRGYRTAYDHYMLNMHDNMKADLAYQKSARQQEVQFQAGATWIVYTDQVSHAAMSGQHVFEQTFHVPLHGLHDPQTAPLRTLERYFAKELV